jgi:hypothetical protein
MRRELWIVVLLLTAGSNSLVPEVCAAHCVTSAATASAHHHHQMNADAEKRLTRASATDNSSSGRRSADCVECAYDTGYGQSLTAACVDLAQAHALKEVSYLLDKPQASSGDTDQCSGHEPISLRAVESHIFLDDPRTVGSSRTAAISLRV